MSVKKGDFLLLNYTCKVKDANEVIGTTYKEVAEEHGLNRESSKHEHNHEHEHEHEAIYEPLFIIVGEGWITKGLEEGIIGKKIGEKIKIEASPEKAYGSRDPSRMRLIPLRKFSKEGINPIPGIQVNIDNKTALVRSVGAGRVQVDFNHPLAGKTLVYETTPEKLLKTDKEKITELIHKNIQAVEKDHFKVIIKEKSVSIELPSEAFFIEGLQYIKRTIVDELRKYMPKFETVTYTEIYKKPKPKTALKEKSK
jgi:peptidylprolyl isomerase